MARKPNYDFERKERDRLKNLKKAARAKATLKPPAEEIVIEISDEAKTGSK